MGYEASDSELSRNAYGSKYSPYQNQTPYDKIYKKTTKESRIQEAEALARESWEYGVVGIFTIGVIFGPWAIIKAIRATRLGAGAAAGFITGAVAIIANIAIISYIVFLFSI